ncbi:hypothetical protein CGI85_23970 [Vibrio parahaemolyticus]|nr:hypothetical protein CGI85_23970 [Vibrio parahaemolyticus]
MLCYVIFYTLPTGLHHSYANPLIKTNDSKYSMETIIVPFIGWANLVVLRDNHNQTTLPLKPATTRVDEAI